MIPTSDFFQIIDAQGAGMEGWGAVVFADMSGTGNDLNSYCRPSLGLGNPARAEILEGDVWGALKIEHYVLPP